VSGRVGWIGAGITVLGTFLVLGLVVQAFAPAPQGPPLSSLSTTPDGVAGWAALLQHAGHPVSQLRTPIADATLRPGATLVVLASAALSAADAARLERFVTAGGRLVIGGPGARTSSARRALGADGADGPGAAVVSPQTSPTTLAAARALRLAATAPLENRDLASADNAEFSLRLAGRASAPVAFAEAIHGFGPATGLAAFPEGWWVAIALLALAAGAFVLARGRRLGGPDPLPAQAPSPRAAYLEAMVATLRSTPERGRLDELAGERALAQRGSRRA
jgi:hypothetical protein